MAMLMSSCLLSLLETFMLELGRSVGLGNIMLQGPSLQITFRRFFGPRQVYMYLRAGVGCRGPTQCHSPSLSFSLGISKESSGRAGLMGLRAV